MRAHVSDTEPEDLRFLCGQWPADGDNSQWKWIPGVVETESVIVRLILGVGSPDHMGSGYEESGYNRDTIQRYRDDQRHRQEACRPVDVTLPGYSTSERSTQDDCEHDR